VSETYDIYFGTDPGNLVPLEANLTATQLSIYGPFEYDTTYYWRVDATNEYGTTTGDVWSFTTLDLDPPISSWELIPGGSGSGPLDDPPGVEGTDFRWLGNNNMVTTRRLVAAAYNRIWYEDI